MKQPFIFKYRPEFLNDFEIDIKLINLLHTFISIDSLNILLVGDSGSGKTSLINCIIKEYYLNNYNPMNILIITPRRRRKRRLTF